jgi:hypothetical protein
MWIGVFPNGERIDTGCKDATDATEYMESYCRDCGIEARYELVWESQGP